MKKTFIILLSGFLISCGGGPSSKLPQTVRTSEEAKKLMLGKTWQVVDLGTSSSTLTTTVNGKKTETPNILFLSDSSKGMDEFTKKELTQRKGVKFEMGSDGNGKAYIDGSHMFGKQFFNIFESKGGVQLDYKVDSAMTGNFGMMYEMIITYRIIGVDEYHLLLETSQTINGQKLIYLMENTK